MPAFKTSPRWASMPVGKGSATPTLSNSVEDPAGPFVGLVVFAAGDVKFTGIDGVADTWTVPSGALPYTIPVAMTRVWTTGTTVAAGDLRGIV